MSRKSRWISQRETARMCTRRLLPLAIGGLTLLCCAPTSGDPAPAPSSRASALTVTTRERTFHSAIPKNELLAATRARMAGPIDEAAFAVSAEELNAYVYAPSSAPEPSSDPGRPVGTSFAADARAAVAQAGMLQGGGVKVACSFRPCMVRGDFDGDGIPDFAIQVARKQDGAGGVGLLLSGSQPQVLAAGNAGPLGTDTIWADGWSVEPAAAVQSGALMVADASPAGAVIKLVGPQGTGVAYLQRVSVGGVVQLKAAVTSGIVP